jgi:hypothetical protein
MPSTLIDTKVYGEDMSIKGMKLCTPFDDFSLVASISSGTVRAN